MKVLDRDNHDAILRALNDPDTIAFFSFDRSERSLALQILAGLRGPDKESQEQIENAKMVIVFAGRNGSGEVH